MYAASTPTHQVLGEVRGGVTTHEDATSVDQGFGVRSEGNAGSQQGDAGSGVRHVAGARLPRELRVESRLEQVKRARPRGHGWRQGVGTTQGLPQFMAKA